MDENNNNIAQIKSKLKEVGAKTTGTKDILIKRLNIWRIGNLNRKLYRIPKVATPSSNIPFPENGFIDMKHATISMAVTLPEILFWFSKNKADSSLKRGRRMGLNRYVVSIRVNHSSEFHKVFFKSKCKAEMKKTAVYNSKIEVNVSGEICKATCDCVAGSGFMAACKHIAAILIVIEHYEQTDVSLEYISPTSKLQTWHRPTKLNSESNYKFDAFMEYKKKEINQSNTESDRLINLFINNRIPSDLTKLRNINVNAYVNDHRYANEPEFELIKSVNGVSTEEIRNIEEMTVQQSKSNLWKTVRRSRITASFVGDIVKTVRLLRNSVTICDKIINPNH